MPRKKKTNPLNTSIPVLGPAKIASPLTRCNFIEDEPGLLINLGEEEASGLNAISGGSENGQAYVSFEKAGPRARTYFDPSKTKLAIVTCGGLCPGINDVIRSIVMEGHYEYGAAAVVGIRYGLTGFIPEYGHDVVELTPQKVSDVHQFGGTMLGSSRGPQSPEEIVDALERMNISALFMIGGDGTMRAAKSIVDEISKRSVRIAVIGIPKTIDNDINFVTKSFGFDTAVEKATEAIHCAHAEAQGVENGIGLVKLMGRESGFIAAQATLALKEVNFVLVPEQPFALDGERGFLAALEKTPGAARARRGGLRRGRWPGTLRIHGAKRTLRAIPCSATSPTPSSPASRPTSASARRT